MKFLALALLLVLAVPMGAQAIVVTCGAGFPCNPATGVCSTRWSACHFDGGVAPCIPHPECSADPSTCFEAAILEQILSGGQPSNWGIVSTGVGCVLPTVPLLAALKVSETQWTGVANYYRNVKARYVRLLRNLSAGRYGVWPSARFNVAQTRFIWYGDLLALLAPLLLDPPNPNYQFLPQPSTTYPAVVMPAPDVTMTAGKIAQHAAWLNALREVNIVAKQLSQTLDNLAGAILDAEAGTPGAAGWVGTLAAHWEAVAAVLAQKGALEVAARSGITGPVISEDAGCATPADAASAFGALVQNGSTLYGTHLVYAGLAGVCATAATFPALLTDDGGVDAGAYAGMALIGMAADLCAANAAYCSTGPVMMVTPPDLDFGSLAVGSVSPLQNVTVRNVGTAPLVIGQIALGGAQAIHFWWKAIKDFCSGQTLAPGASCLVGFKFIPLTTGPLAAHAKVPSNVPLVKVKLTGTGL